MLRAPDSGGQNAHPKTKISFFYTQRKVFIQLKDRIKFPIFPKFPILQIKALGHSYHR